MIYVAIVGLLALAFWVYWSFRASKKPKDRVRLYCGTMGSGKTFNAVNDTVRAYKRMLFRSRLMPWKYKTPHFYSNIPIQLRKLKRKERNYLTCLCGRKIKNVDHVAKYCLDSGVELRSLLENWGVLNKWITKEHLFLNKLLPDNTCVLLDEMSLIADQYSHDIPEVREQLVFFIGFCRHWFLGHGGLLACTAQATDSIVKQVRTKFGVCVLLSNFRRLLWITPWYVVDVHEMLNADDVRIVDDDVTIEKKIKPYYFGYLGYRKRFYNSRCYSLAYAEKFTHEPDFRPHLCTRYIIDVQCSKAESKDYANNREKYRSVLFSDTSSEGGKTAEV